MKIEQPVSDFFTAGGTLPPDAPSYVKRPTDDELFRHVMAGEFCYVLTPRQMGKSSLMIRTAQRLQSEGFRSAIVDLTVTGTVESEDQWYKGILTQIKRRLRINIDPVNWWEQRKDIPNIQKFVEFFEEVLTEVKERVVIFMDEIDTTLKLDFRDDFFAGIRAIFNARAENPDLKRLTFVLLGVASPSDLIKDRNRTPFNIGQEIPLRPFSRESARMLETGLEESYPGSGKKILDRIFYWTNGHPYLTQKLCQSVVETEWKEFDENAIDLLVQNLFTSEEASRETNLQFVRDNVLNYPERRVILSLYKKLLRGDQVRDNKNSLPQNHLKLSGLARVEDGKLVVSNKIYRRVFDQRWVNRYTEIDWRYLIIGALSLIVLAFLGVFYNDGVRLPNQAATRVNGIPVYKDDRGIQYLADLFRMEPFVFANEYEYKAKDTFFNGFTTWEEQKALIEIAYGEPHPSPEDYQIVVAGLYTSLADVDTSSRTTELLELMQASLKEMKLQENDLYKEITYWLAARRDASNNNLQGALEQYNQAIALNPQNPATLFERARIYAEREEYENALKDYEQVVAIAPVCDVEPTTAPTSATSIVTGISSATPSGNLSSTPEFTSTGVSDSTPILRLTNTPAGTPAFPGTSVPSNPQIPVRATSTPTLTPTSVLLPVQPKFLTLGQRIAAVNNDIGQNHGLISFLSSVNLSDYQNLDSLGLLVTATPTSVLASLTTETPRTPVTTPLADCETGKVCIRWFVGLGTGTDSSQVTVEEEVVADFNASQDRIQLNLEVVPFDQAFDVLSTQIASGNGPDIVGPVGWGSSNDFHGEWLDLTPYIESSGFDTSIYDPALVRHYQTGEGQVALPFAVFPGAIYYVPALFDEAGLNYPPQTYGQKYVLPDGSEVEWSWDTLTEIAKLLTVDINGNNSTEPGFDSTQIVQVGYVPQWQTIQHIGTLYGGAASLYTGDAKGSYVSTIPDSWKEAFQWYYDGMWGEQPFMPTGPLAGAPEFDNGNVFNSGRAAMALTQSWYTCCIFDFQSGVNEFQLAVQPMGADGAVHGRVDMDSFRIWKGTEHPAETFEVFVYLITTGGDKLLPVYGAMSADVSKAGAYLESKAQDYPFVTTESWDVFLQGYAYPDIPSSEQYQPNPREATNRFNSFLNLLNNTPPDELDFDTEFQKLIDDLNTIYNQ